MSIQCTYLKHFLLTLSERWEIMIYTIDKNPEDEVYEDLMDLAFDICDTFHLVLRTDMGNIRSLDSFIEKLKDSFIEMKRESKWASTMLADENKAEVYYFHADENSKKVIKQFSNSLYDWCLSEPNILPEDLSFFKEGHVWLVNCAHERQSHISTEDANEIKQLKSITGLNISESHN